MAKNKAMRNVTTNELQHRGIPPSVCEGRDTVGSLWSGWEVMVLIVSTCDVGVIGVPVDNNNCITIV